MVPSTSSVRGRLAPSPTGALHMGNVRSFVLTWLAARSCNGWIELRIEDLDTPRVREGAVEGMLDDLVWLGLDWDDGPRFQAQRVAEFRSRLEWLADQDLAYPCICSRRDIEAAASAPHAGEEGPVYPGTCRGRFGSVEEAKKASADGRVAWRFAVPQVRVVQWSDRIAGAQRFDVPAQLGDFVIWKKDDEPAYQLAVVVDDGLAGINQVVRGDDLLPSTARQILLHEALQQDAPEWWHLPLVHDEDGRRMAKRTGDATLQALRGQGGSVEQVLGWVAETSGIRLASAPRCAADLLAGFDPDRVPRSAVSWRGIRAR